MLYPPNSDYPSPFDASVIERPLPGTDNEVVYWIGDKADEYNTPIDRLITGDVFIDWGTDIEQMTQSEFFSFWNSYEKQVEITDNERSVAVSRAEGAPSHLCTPDCAICGRLSVSFPAIDRDCEICGGSKHELMQLHWDLAIEELSADDEFSDEPLYDIPVQDILFKDGITCPDGHFLCNFCHSELPDRRPIDPTKITVEHGFGDM